MISKIRKSRLFRLTSLTLAFSLFIDLILPRQAFALTGGPAQPEFNSFTPIGTSDMVDLSSGDMNYNIPLMDVGGYPLNLAYSANVSMDEEASYVGLGWNLAVGQINRNVRGLPDDFNGDELTYENYLKPNVTVGASFEFEPGVVGVEGIGEIDNGQSSPSEGSVASIGVSVVYNNYTGLSVKPSFGMNFELHKNASVGFNAVSGPDGLVVSPNISLHHKSSQEGKNDHEMKANFGVSMNSRQGLSQMTIQATKKAEKNALGTKRASSRDKDPSVGSTISFTDPVYTPTKRVGMQTSNFTVNAQLGSEIFGGEGAGEITAYGTVMKVKDEELEKQVKAYGYVNTHNAGSSDVLDFNRENDASYSVNTRNLALTNYTYDIYSIQGQGVSGSYRPYRNQVGYVYDTYVSDGSFSGTLGLEAGTGNLFNIGIDLEASGVESHSGNWSQSTGVQPYLEDAGSSSFEYERVHYKNVGDLSADNESSLFTQIGGYQPVAVPIIGLPFYRKTASTLKAKVSPVGSNILSVGAPIQRTQRQNRNQAIYNLTVADVNNGVGFGPLAYTNASENYTLPSGARNHHTAEVQITRNDGARYVYGLPAYNTLKREATFAVDAENGDCASGLVTYTPSALNNPKSLPNDKYFNRVTTPAYVHTHLLTAVLSTDYQDKTGDGPTADDLGSYTKFKYVKKDSNYKWRIPFEGNKANYNEGLKTDSKDDRGNYVYGEKELYYVDQIETKTHVAVFHYSTRKDARGVDGEAGGMGAEEYMYKLDKISLYSVGEYDGLGVNSTSTPIKEVYFEYSYSLCPGVPNNDGNTSLDDNELSNNGGKLTLKKVYFQYRNSAMGKYTGYHFNYGEYTPLSDGNGGYYHPDEYDDPTLDDTDLNTVYNSSLPTISGLNPEYNMKGYDIWGKYKPNSEECGNLYALTAPEFPFVDQDKTIQDNRASVWCMREIELPSGGKITIEYESDDYAYVQDREVMRMFKVWGAGKDMVPSGSETPLSSEGAVELFGNPIPNSAKRYLYVEVDDNEDASTSAEIEAKYLKGIVGGPPIYFRFFMNTTMVGGTSNGNDPAKFDYVTGYLEHEETVGACDGFSISTRHYISIPIKLVDKEGGLFGSVGLTNDVHPISKATWHFGRKYLNNHVYSDQPNGDTEDIAAIVADILTPSVLNNLFEIFNGPNATLENKNIGRQFIAGKSWLRLTTPHKFKLGGGNRVKEIRMSDVWEDMNTGATGYQTMNYGQSYEYTLADGTTSGVATYEPVGNKENPFVQPEFTKEKNLLAPDEENFIERPFGECFFPSPQVTYSRVSVANVDAGVNPGYTVKQRNKTGKVVTEFYTSKDFPTIVDQTEMIPLEDKTPFVFNLLKLITKKHLTMSQGYVVHLNDMNGKQKSQRVYAEGQTTAISGVDYKYSMHSANSGSAASDPDQNKGRLNNRVKVIYPDGSIGYRSIGVETDIVFDFRENATHSTTIGLNTNLATFMFGVIPLPVPMLLPDISINDDQFHSVTSTKVINTFGLLEETIAYDAGAAVYTKNLAWDAVTGEVLVTETVDEYNDKYYTMNYPAHWVYDGMGQAAKNLGLTGTLTASGLGYTVSGVTQVGNYIRKGDELYLSGMSGSDKFAWVSNIQGSVISLIDADGNAITGGSSAFEVTRSGRRNLQSAGIMNVTLMHNPLTDLSGNTLLNLGTSYLTSSNWDDWLVINAGAVDYSQKWKFPCECEFDNSSQGGIYNPYRFNELGIWRTKSSRTYLTGRNQQAEITPRREGFFTSFSPMYKLTGSGNWYKDFSDWTYVAEVSKYSPYGFELENKDALDRYSAAQYGYNNTFPMAVGANTEYREIGFDGFEDYIGFNGCPNAHFTFKEVIDPQSDLSSDHSHTGKYSLKVGQSSSTGFSKALSCVIAQP